MLQCFIPLGDSRGAAAATLLQQAGFFLGGFLPAWFGEDGLLMQKLFIDPGFESLKLHSERARTLATLVRNDWQRSWKDSTMELRLELEPHGCRWRVAFAETAAQGAGLGSHEPPCWRSALKSCSLRSAAACPALS